LSDVLQEGSNQKLTTVITNLANRKHQSFVTGAMSQTPKQDEHTLRVFTSKQILAKRKSTVVRSEIYGQSYSLTFKH